MPEKIRKLKAKLRKAGFVYRQGKGSHTVWYDPSNPQNEVTLSGHDGKDANKWQILLVNKALEEKEWNH
jgi:predicted RNA binding protein YcfA (HicA-like mRNA interferase family)